MLFHRNDVMLLIRIVVLSTDRISISLSVFIFIIFYYLFVPFVFISCVRMKSYAICQLCDVEIYPVCLWHYAASRPIHSMQRTQRNENIKINELNGMVYERACDGSRFVNILTTYRIYRIHTK